MNIIRRTEPPLIQVDDARSELDFKVLAEEISKALEAALKKQSEPQSEE
jgi:hypothetical protein